MFVLLKKGTVKKRRLITKYNKTQEIVKKKKLLIETLCHALTNSFDKDYL